MEAERQAVLLAELGQQLAELGMLDGLGNAGGTMFPGLAVGCDSARGPVLVFVSASAGCFTWYEAGNTHPITDVSGAAGKLAAFVWGRECRGDGP